MPTDNYSLPTGKTGVPGATVTPQEADAVGNLDLVLEALGRLFGPGCLTAADCAPVPVGGTLFVLMPANSRAVVHHSTYGHKVVVVPAATAVGPLAANRPTGAPNYLYVQRAAHPALGSYAHNVTGTAPAGAILVATAVTDATAVTSVDSMPSGRANLISALAVKVTEDDAEASYLADALVAGGYVSIAVDTEDDGTQTLVIGTTAALDAALSDLSAATDEVEEVGRAFRRVLRYLTDEVGFDLPEDEFVLRQYERAHGEEGA